MQFQVTAAELQAAAANCVKANAAIQGQITQMRNYVAGLMAVYQGTAALALQALSDQWGADAAALNNVLTTIATNLNGNAANYTDNENTNTNNFMQLLGALPPARF